MFEMCVSQVALPSTLIIYKGEQHGFRTAANIGHARLSEYLFLLRNIRYNSPKTGGWFRADARRRSVATAEPGDYWKLRYQHMGLNFGFP